MDVKQSTLKKADANNDLVGNALAEIRARVLGGRDTLTPEDEIRVQEELRHVREVDINKMDLAFVNEDPALKAHIEASRRRLMEHERRMMRDPNRKALHRQNFIKTMGLTSDVYRAMQSSDTDARNIIETAHHIAKQAQLLAEGKQPRGYSAPITNVSTALSAVAHVAQDGAKVADEIEELYKQHTQQMNEVFVVRRKFDEVVSGLLALLEECDEDRRLLREHLQDLSKTVAAREAVDPASTLGEQLLAAPVLPEDAGI